MPDLHYENLLLAEIYDLDSGWSIDREFYLSLAAGSPKRILDLGCGTGLLCDACTTLDEAQRVEALDPLRFASDGDYGNGNQCAEGAPG